MKVRFQELKGSGLVENERIDNHITVDDLFCPFTHEDFVKQNMTGNLDSHIKHKIALQLLSGEKNTVIQAFVSKPVIGGYWAKFKAKPFSSFLALAFVIAVPFLIYKYTSYGLIQTLIIIGGWILGTTRLVKTHLPKSRKQLEVEYMEVNQDAIIDDSLPYDLLQSIYRNWRGYHSSNKNPHFEDLMEKRLERAKKNAKPSLLHKYEALFTQTSPILPNKYIEFPHKWAMIGIWALATPKPEEKGKWKQRDDLERFAQTEFFNAVSDVISDERLDLSPRRKKEFEDNCMLETFMTNIQSTFDESNVHQIVLDAILKLE